MGSKQLKQTKFDSLVTNRTMQLVKAVIPYIDNNIGTLIGMLIKFQELQNAAKINNNVAIAALNADKHKGIENMLEDIMDFLSDDAKESIENMKNMMEMMEMMNMDENAMNDLMGSFMNGSFGSEFNDTPNDSDESDNNNFSFKSDEQ